MQVAKLINSSATLGTERGTFYVQAGGFDTHSDVKEVLQGNLGEIDAALASFVAEMKHQGRWDDVTIVSVSEFGRTLTSNGAGTDHGWGGCVPRSRTMDLWRLRLLICLLPCCLRSCD